MYIFNDMNTNTKEQFLELWADNIGSMADGFGVPPELGVLQGLAIEVAGDDGLRGDEPAVLVKALSAADLPATAAPRFAHLFKVKREWTIDEVRRTSPTCWTRGVRSSSSSSTRAASSAATGSART